MTRVRAVVAIVLLFLFGCAGGDPRVAVSGTVTLKGAPLKAGSITFEPAEGTDSRGGAGITDGKFEIPKTHGLKPGKYLVRVTAGDGKTPANDEAGGPGGSTNIVSKELVPADWNTNSKQQVTVTKEGPNAFTFDIK